YIESEPLYPFGYGLTYGDVTVSAVSCSGSPAMNGAEIALEDQEAFKLHVKLTNQGQMATGEVVQVYIKAQEAPDATPAAKLCGFARTRVEAGGEASVTIPIGAEAFTVVNEEGERLVEGRTFTVSVGLGQPDARTKALTGKDCITFTVKLA
ncbi:MAG: fibronectin type III-like domain-contianing protein, partial [Acetatifactor sp.]|nr:fibronectin type III-like domain-contianing protein [Acetatifactor sp.]